MSGDSNLVANGATYATSDFQQLVPVIPDSIRFTSTKKGVAARRTPVKIRSEQQTYASNNNKLMRIFLPNSALYDTRNGFISCTMQLSWTGGTYARLHSGSFSAINRLRVLVNATEVEDIRDWNRIYAMLWEMINPPDVTSSIGVTAMNFGTQLQRNALFPVSGSSVSMIIPLYSGFLNTELLPLNEFKAGVVLELYIEDPTTCVETDGTNPIIQISNIEFHIERLELDRSYTNFIANYVRANGLQIGYHTWERYINALTTGSTQNLMINHRSSSMNGILNVFVNSAQINNTIINDKYLTWPSTLGGTFLLSVNLLINGMTFPDEPIDCASTYRYAPYQMYCRWIMKWKLNGFLDIAPPITNYAYNNLNRFVQIDDLEAYPEEPSLVNPFTTLQNNSTIIKKLVFGATIPTSYQQDSWVEYFRQIKISFNGASLVLQ